MRHTDNITVTIAGYGPKPCTYTLSREIGSQLAKFLDHSTGDTDSIPAELALPELYDPVLGPARVLKGFRYREGLTQKQLAEKLGVRQHHLSEMENAKRPISKDMAKRLAEILKCDFRIFM